MDIGIYLGRQKLIWSLSAYSVLILAYLVPMLYILSVMEFSWVGTELIWMGLAPYGQSITPVLAKFGQWQLGPMRLSDIPFIKTLFVIVTLIYINLKLLSPIIDVMTLYLSWIYLALSKKFPPIKYSSNCCQEDGGHLLEVLVSGSQRRVLKSLLCCLGCMSC